MLQSDQRCWLFEIFLPPELLAMLISYMALSTLHSHPSCLYADWQDPEDSNGQQKFPPLQHQSGALHPHHHADAAIEAESSTGQLSELSTSAHLSHSLLRD